MDMVRQFLYTVLAIPIRQQLHVLTDGMHVNGKIAIIYYF